ncbi:cell wall-binding repeat-containing protein [Haloimpatiens sp. FM7330]|uniref:cell wall-binding repeat-containing protein n=1 Tax=Haloimpatiens sp. FM7330 TaxID=3298610 RepID=UPI00362B6CD8
MKKLISLLLYLTLITSTNVYFAPKVYSINLSNISRKQVQERSYKMAYDVWKFVKSLNGNVKTNTKLPDHLIGKTTSYEYGIPYNWGGFDGLDTRSSTSWINYYNAINKGAMAGNILTSGGYKGGTAGIDCSGFVQSALKIGGYKQSTWTLGNHMIPISFDSLRNMDILLLKSSHILFFQSWVYDVRGNKLGAITIESTTSNYDGSGQKVKQYYRSLDELKRNYVAYRYKEITSDYIETNSAIPTIESPLYRQAIYKNNVSLTFKWTFNSKSSTDFQTAYRIRIFRGNITSTYSKSGILLYNFSENNAISEKAINIQALSNGDYYFVLETKNNKGYWSNPVMSPFKIIDNSYIDNSRFSNINRYGGANRFETSKLIAENFFSTNLDKVILTYGYNFADGLTGVTLSKKLNAPILLVDKNVTSSSNSPTLEYILKNLNKNGQIYILGGEGVIDNSYINYFIQNGYSKNNIIRLYGNDRDETSVKIAQYLNTTEGTPIIISNNGSFADSLSISPTAGYNIWPILLTPTNKLDDNVEKYIISKKPSKVFIVGGNGVISDNVKNRIKQITGLSDNKIVRLSGNNRYETSKVINSYFYSNSSNKIFTAYGQNFPDSLSGAAVLAINNSPLVLVSENSYLNAASAINTVSSTNKVEVNILGGNRIITNYLISRIENICTSSQ